MIYHKHSATAGRYSKFKVFHSEKNRVLNEILNFPLQLILLGEIFFILKAFTLLIYPFLNRKSKGYGYLKNVGVIDMTLLLVKARFWVIFNFSAILKDRAERKNKGFINAKIFNFFCWNLLK